MSIYFLKKINLVYWIASIIIMIITQKWYLPITRLLKTFTQVASIILQSRWFWSMDGYQIEDISSEHLFEITNCVTCSRMWWWSYYFKIPIFLIIREMNFLEIHFYYTGICFWLANFCGMFMRFNSIKWYYAEHSLIEFKKRCNIIYDELAFANFPWYRWININKMIALFLRKRTSVLLWLLLK